MAQNTVLWDKLGKTDPSHTKGFTRGGGFRGTAIKPMWSYRRMTEEFGPCGVGWGINKPEFQVVPSGDEILVFCTVSIWYVADGVMEAKFRDTISEVYGVGGDKVAGKNKNGVQTDDEAFKKAFTDAVTNALKMIGVGADVHMGMFDDSKYVNTVQREFAEAKADIPPPANDKPKSSAQLKRDGEWERVTKAVADEMLDVHTFGQFEKVKEHWREEARKSGWNSPFMFQLRDLLEGYEDELTKKIQAENDPVAEIQDQFGGRVVNETVREQHVLEAGE